MLTILTNAGSVWLSLSLIYQRHNVLLHVYITIYSNRWLEGRAPSKLSLLCVSHRYPRTHTQASFLGGVARGSVSNTTSYTKDHRHCPIWLAWDHSRLVRTSSLHYSSSSRSSAHSVSLRTTVSLPRMLYPDLCSVSETTPLCATQYTKRFWRPLVV